MGATETVTGALKVADLQVGDVVSPPQREISLWMRRDAVNKGLGEAALAITIETVREGPPDKRGRWVCIAGYLPKAWYTSGTRYLFTFKARPETLWPLLSAAKEPQT